MSVYFIRDANLPEVKIGHSWSPQDRLAQLRCITRRELQLLKTIPGAAAEEKALHSRFKEYHLHGEWFRLSGKLARFIGRKRPAKIVPFREVLRDTVARLTAQHTKEKVASMLMMTVADIDEILSMKFGK